MAEDIIVNFLSERDEVTGKFDDIGENADKASGKVGGVGMAFGGLKTAALIGGGAAALAIAGIGTAALDVSLQTDAAAAQMAASLGIPIDKANEFAEVAKDVYGNNFAGSIEEAAGAVEILVKQIDGLDSDANGLQAAAEDALALKDVFDVDVSDSIDAVDTLMETFGLSAEEAFDLVTAGFQNGLDRSGDFLDSIGEYSTQFSEGGATAKEMFALLESGLEGGVLGTDKAADAFKEFRLRINDGTKATHDATAALLGSDEAAVDFFDKLDSGSLTAVDAFGIIITEIGKTESSTARMGHGTALLGTQFEDLGDKAVTELSFVSDSFANVEGATESLDAKYKTFGDIFSGISRRLVTSVSPITDRLLDISIKAMPKVESAFSIFEENFIPVIDSLVAAIKTATDFINGMFSGEEFAGGIAANMTTLNTLKEWFDTNLPLMKETVRVITDALTGFWTEHGDTIQTINDTTFKNIQVVIDTTLKTILNIITLFMAAITGDWELFGGTLKQIMTDLWGGITTIFTNSLDGIKSIFADKTPNIAEKAQGMADSALSSIEDVLDGTAIKRIGNDVKEGLSIALSSDLSDVKKSAKGMGESLLDSITGILGIQSPSTAFFKIGKFVIDGLLGGLKENESVSSFLDEFSGKMNNFLDVEAANKAGMAYATSMMTGVEEGMIGKQDSLKKTIDMVVGGWPDIITELWGSEARGREFAIGMMTGVEEGMISKQGALKKNIDMVVGGWPDIMTELWGSTARGREYAVDMMDGVEEGMTSKQGRLKDVIDMVVGGWPDIITELWGSMARGREFAVDMMDGVTDGLNSSADRLKPHMVGVANHLKTNFVGNITYSHGQAAGSGFIDGFTQGINIASPNAIAASIALGQSVLTALNNELGVQSPSWKTAKSAKDFVSPLADLDATGPEMAAADLALGMIRPIESIGQQSGLAGVNNSNNNSVSTQNNIYLTLQVSGDTMEQADQVINELQFRYNANLAGA